MPADDDAPQASVDRGRASARGDRPSIAVARASDDRLDLDLRRHCVPSKPIVGRLIGGMAMWRARLIRDHNERGREDKYRQCGDDDQNGCVGSHVGAFNRGARCGLRRSASAVGRRHRVTTVSECRARSHGAGVPWRRLAVGVLVGCRGLGSRKPLRGEGGRRRVGRSAARLAAGCRSASRMRSPSDVTSADRDPKEEQRAARPLG